ncbi:hypothetical protein DOTSEDRAFT_36805 [Dothistroma septosporum NZE10]|uniref:Uncharacterized protein n=1 Tax=Dothistroma septosporum (strain NZE10 / CBS 128990) TaxID=675120 RepID=N1PIM4_DOTSN|nr:hypothetical protein DOTSEDRAFT_36805 [Dothistroma septosporum NZE10]
MQLLTVLLGAIAAAGAAPIDTNRTLVSDSVVPTNITIEGRSEAMCLNCTSCKAKQDGIALKYIVRVGAPFGNGQDCDSVKKILQASNLPDNEKFHCRADKGDMTHLDFDAWD